MDKILLDCGPSGPESMERLRAFARCPQLYAFNHLAPGLRGPPAPPLIKGSLVHVGLGHHAARRQAQQQGKNPDAFHEPLAAMALTAQANRAEWGTETDTHLYNLQKVVHAFMERDYEEDFFRNWEILYVEQAFRFSVGPYAYTQKPDLVLRNTLTQKIVPHDWKTSSAAGKKVTYTRYTNDLKFLALGHWGPNLWGKSYGGSVVFSIGLLDPFVFERHPMAPVPSSLANFEKTVLSLEERIAGETDRRHPLHAWPRAFHEQVCVSSYGTCEMWDVCTTGDNTRSENAAAYHDVKIKFSVEDFKRP